MAGELVSAAIAGAAATVAFGPTLACTTERQFLPYDDIANFLDVDGWRVGNWRDRVLWATTATRGFVYEPLSWVLKGAQADVLGMSPVHFAAVSALAHVLTAMLLAQLLALVMHARQPGRRRGDHVIVARLAAAWWCVHPWHAEAIGWASAQPYVWTGVFASAALLLHAKARLEPACGGVAGAAAKRFCWCGGLLGCLLSMLCKSSAMTLPVLFVVLELALEVDAGSSQKVANLQLLKNLRNRTTLNYKAI